MIENVIMSVLLLAFLLVFMFVPIEKFYKASTFKIKEVTYIESDNRTIFEIKYKLLVRTYFGFWITIDSDKDIDSVRRRLRVERIKAMGLKKVEKIIDSEV